MTDTGPQRTSVVESAAEVSELRTTRGRAFVFFCGPGHATLPLPTALSNPYSFTIWRPSLRSFWAPGVIGQKRRWFAQWLLHRFHLFATRDYSAVLIHCGDELVHHSMVYPKCYRIPAMAREDLEIGTIWTKPEHRRRDLALFAVQEIVRLYSKPGRTFWYVCRKDNYPSVGLAERVGFRCVGSGIRIPKLGTRAIGVLIINEYSTRETTSQSPTVNVSEPAQTEDPHPHEILGFDPQPDKLK